MKTKLFIKAFAIILTLSSFSLIAQPPQAGRHHSEEYKEKIRSMRIAYLTERLSLSTEEAQKFWPVYNEYHDELNELRKEKWRYKMQDIDIAELSEKEAAEFAENEIRKIEKTAELKRKYHEKYLEILPVKKVAILYEAEKEFNRKLFREMRRRQRERR